MSLGIRVMELLCSRLCHDLVGPIGAVNNGVELLDEGGDSGGEALDLIADSAQTAAARLRLYRLALGAAGGQSTPGDARAALEGWLRGGKVRLDWSAALSAPPPGLLKCVLLAGLLAEETLPRGGTIKISGGDGGVSIAATGPACGLRPEMGPALAGQMAEADIGPRSVLSHVVPLLAQGYGLSLTVEVPPAGGEVGLRIQPVAG